MEMRVWKLCASRTCRVNLICRGGSFALHIEKGALSVTGLVEGLGESGGTGDDSIEDALDAHFPNMKWDDGEDRK